LNPESSIIAIFILVAALLLGLRTILGKKIFEEVILVDGFKGMLSLVGRLLSVPFKIISLIAKHYK